MFSLGFYKGFSVMRSMHLQETACMLCQMAYKLHRDLVLKENPTRGGYYFNNPNISQPNEYAAVVKKVKKANITAENIGEIMLQSIPGVGAETAKAVLLPYGGKITDFVRAITDNPTEFIGGAKARDEAKSRDEVADKRKISKSARINILNYFGVITKST